MSKKQLIVLIAVSSMRTAATLLRNLDANTTGADDEAAKALEVATTACESYLSA